MGYGIIDFMLWLHLVNEFLWTHVCLSLIVLSGVVLMVRLRGQNLLRILSVPFTLFVRGQSGISPFSALMTALSGTVGTGNIAGIAAAVYLGGPGVIFYMWIIGFFSLSVKYAEGYLAVKYRQHRGLPRLRRLVAEAPWSVAGMGCSS